MSEEKKELGLKIGRPCCGSRTMCLSQDGVDRKSKFVDFREFKGRQNSKRIRRAFKSWYNANNYMSQTHLWLWTMRSQKF